MPSGKSRIGEVADMASAERIPILQAELVRGSGSEEKTPKAESHLAMGVQRRRKICPVLCICQVAQKPPKKYDSYSRYETVFPFYRAS